MATVVGKGPDLKIEALYAFVAVDENGEGLIAQTMPLPNGREVMMPFVGADWDRVQSLIPHAKNMEKETGKTIRVFKFSGKEDITEQVFSETGD